MASEKSVFTLTLTADPSDYDAIKPAIDAFLKELLVATDDITITRTRDGVSISLKDVGVEKGPRKVRVRKSPVRLSEEIPDADAIAAVEIPGSGDGRAARTGRRGRPKGSRGTVKKSVDGRRRGRPSRLSLIAADNPKDYLDERMALVNAKGVKIEEIQSELKDRFPGFKIKDLGVGRLKTYFDDDPRYEVEKRRNGYVVYLAEDDKGDVPADSPIEEPVVPADVDASDPQD